MLALFFISVENVGGHEDNGSSFFFVSKYKLVPTFNTHVLALQKRMSKIRKAMS